MQTLLPKRHPAHQNHQIFQRVPDLLLHPPRVRHGLRRTMLPASDRYNQRYLDVAKFQHVLSQVLPTCACVCGMLTEDVPISSIISCTGDPMW
jgi:hypothetical protein